MSETFEADPEDTQGHAADEPQQENPEADQNDDDTEGHRARPI